MPHCAPKHRPMDSAVSSSDSIFADPNFDDKCAYQRAEGTTYRPRNDYVDGKVLVVYIRPDPQHDYGFIETIVYLGSTIEYALEGDPGAIENDWCEYIENQNRKEHQDGLYVLTCRWCGPADDMELGVLEARPINDEERVAIKESGLKGIVHAWMPMFQFAPCACCDRPGEDHIDHALSCPTGSGSSDPV